MEAMVTRLLEQEVAVRAVLSEDRKTSHLIPSWQDIDVLESISKALSPISKLTDFLIWREPCNGIGHCSCITQFENQNPTAKRRGYFLDKGYQEICFG